MPHENLYLCFCDFFIFLTGCSDNSLTWKEKAELAFQEKDYSKAITYLEAAASEAPENPEIQYYLGQAYRLVLFDDGSKINTVDRHTAQKSSAHFRNVIEISPKMNMCNILMT